VLSDGIAKTTQKEWSNKIPDSKDIPKTHRVIPKTHTFPAILHFLNQTPMDWYSKKQATVETATLVQNSSLQGLLLIRSSTSKQLFII
jgi:hypothetical protein